MTTDSDMKKKSLRLERTTQVLNRVLDGIFMEGINASDLETCFESVLKTTNGIKVVHLQKLYQKINEQVRNNVEDEFAKMFFKESDIALKLVQLEELIEECEALELGGFKNPKIGYSNPEFELKKTICDAKRDHLTGLQERLVQLQNTNSNLQKEYEETISTDLDAAMRDIDAPFETLDQTVKRCLQQC